MRASQWILFAAAVVEVILVSLFAWYGHTGSPFTRAVGVCLIVFVAAVVVIARFELGRSFSITPQARQLVTTGIYARVRNPIYVVTPLQIIGLALLSARWWIGLTLVFVIPLQVIRARREAAVLRAAFGEAYDHYRAHTWF